MSATTQRRPSNPGEPRPYWQSVTIEAFLDDAKLARALAAMDLKLRLAAIPRGDISWWPPQYRRHVPWRVRIGESHTAAGHGFRSGNWSDEACAELDRQDAIERERVAEINRWRRDAPVLIMARKRVIPRDLNQYDCYAIDTCALEWRGMGSLSSQFGHDLISLGMVMWQCGFPQAAGRIARAIGIEIPKVVPNG